MLNNSKLLRTAALLMGVGLACLVLMPLAAKAQFSGLENGPPPPPPENAEPAPPPPADSGKAAEPKKSQESAKAAEPAKTTEPAWDPLHAGRSLEIGIFYKKKGNYDAAIERFRDAARLQPGLAKPYLLMGEVYEKTHDPASAVANYRKYLDLFRTAPDREEIQKRIDRLENSVNRQADRGPSR